MYIYKTAQPPSSEWKNGEEEGEKNLHLLYQKDISGGGKTTFKEKQNFQTAIPLLLQPPGPLQAYTHSPHATQTATVMPQKVLW